MQQEEQTTSSNRTAMPPIQIPTNNHRGSDVGSGNLSDEPAVVSPPSTAEVPVSVAT